MAVWSPDGKKIAYQGATASTPPSTGGLVVMNADGTGGSQLTTGGDFNLAWSHDGKRIAFDRFTPPTPTSLPTDFVYVINADGSNAIRLSESTPNGLLQFPVWLPGDQAIAFSSDQGSNPPHSAIYAIDPDGSHLRQLFSDPVWNYNMLAPAPDGLRFAVEASSKNGGLSQIFVLVPGQSPIQLTQQGGMNPRWSPDGNAIAFNNAALQTGDPYRIYVMNADGSDQTALPTGVAPGQTDYGLTDWAPV